jgi:predicted nuclease of predicted toxin-antitoxin system
MAKISLYFDEMMPRKPAEQLGVRGYQVVMAVDSGMVKKTDPEHLKYATEHDYVLVTFDRKFANLTSQQTDHSGLVCLTLERQDNFGAIVRVLS